MPEGQFDDERRAAIVRDVTDAVLRAENNAHPYDPNRVWVFTNEIPDGTWGGAGRINRLADIVGYVVGDADNGPRLCGAAPRATPSASRLTARNAYVILPAYARELTGETVAGAVDRSPPAVNASA